MSPSSSPSNSSSSTRNTLKNVECICEVLPGEPIQIGSFSVSTAPVAPAPSRLGHPQHLVTDGPYPDSSTCWDLGSEAPQRLVNLAALFVCVASRGPYAREV